MVIHNLPYDIFPQGNVATDSIIIHDYSAAVGSFKGKSILHTNAISLVINGEKTMHFAEQVVHIKDDTFHFLSSGNCLASVALAGHPTFRSILIFFTNAVLSEFHLKYKHIISGIERKQDTPPEPFLCFDKDEFAYNYIKSLDIMLHSGQPLSQEMKLLKFEELMLHLLHKHPDKLLSFKTDKEHELGDMEIRKAVEMNITSNITLEELAFICNTSLSTFKRKFTRLYGTSPTKWILQQRMLLAKRLLLQQAEKPGEIFHKLGYENHSSFSQAFKQTFGISPKDFQQQNLSF